ncbi:MAG: hypothetical protein V1862_02725 [Methanobacteriota archaeon]
MMKQTNLGFLGISIIAALVILALTLPVSGAVQAGPQDGTGSQYGGQVNQNAGGQYGGFGNGTCLQADCPYNGTQPRDGTGMRSGQTGTGHGPDGRGSGCRFTT